VLRSLVAVLVVLLLGAAAAGAYWQLVLLPAQAQRSAGGAIGRPGAGMPVAVEAAEVRVGPAEVTVEAVGTLLSDESVLLRPEVSGRIVDFNFTEGEPVTRGQALVRLDDSVEQAELKEAEARLQLADANHQRASSLVANRAGTQRALDEAEAARNTARASLELARARLGKKTLVAPFDAIAGLRRVSPGDYVSDGDDIVNLEKIQPLKVDFRVPEIFLANLKVGRPIRVVIDAFRDRGFEGRILAINPLVDAGGRAVVIRAQVANDDRVLRPGLFARVTLSLSEQAEAVFVPEAAIVPDAGQRFVYRVEPGDAPTARRVAVETGKRLPGEVQVTKGLAAGDRVVTAGVLKLRDGAAVKLIPAGGGEGAKPVPPTPADPAG
jgi:membrane fusion protein, multidrug efflux system